jgi:phosphoglycolate phosphatase-like HAD superfamily hydrolase
VRLVLFDVDGTLLDNRGDSGRACVDDDCFARAFRREFGIERIEMDWSRYPHCTDSSITRGLLADRFGRPATEDEVLRARDGYVEELRRAADAGEDVASPMRGVAEAFAALAADGWSAALATGGWRASALLKLSHARLAAASLPGAFADDALTREEITSLARGRAESAAGRPADRVVYVGDATWDVTACAALALPFVGVGRGEQAERLRRAGATIVLPDLAERFLDALDAAVAPR